MSSIVLMAESGDGSITWPTAIVLCVFSICVAVVAIYSNRD